MSNPYPSPVDIGAVIHQAYLAGQLNGGSWWLWNPYGATAGMFVLITDTPHYIIQSNTSFQVRAHDSTSVLHFREINKAEVGTLFALKAKADVVALNVYDESYHVWDMLNFKFADGTTDEEDGMNDAGKPVNPDLNFYSWSSDRHPLSLDVRPYQAGKVIPLGFTTSYVQNFIIKVDNFAVPSGGQVYLHDKYLGTYALLNQGTEYKFAVTKDPASQGDNRFELGLEPGDAQLVHAKGSLKVLMVPNPASSGVNITFIAPSQEKTSVRFLSVEGVCVMTQELGVQQSGSVNLNLDNLASGVYMVEFTSGSDKVVQRLVKE